MSDFVCGYRALRAGFATCGADATFRLRRTSMNIWLYTCSEHVDSTESNLWRHGDVVKEAVK